MLNAVESSAVAFLSGGRSSGGEVVKYQSARFIDRRIKPASLGTQELLPRTRCCCCLKEEISILASLLIITKLDLKLFCEKGPVPSKTNLKYSEGSPP